MKRESSAVLLINQIAGSQTGGFTGREEIAVSYFDTLAPTYLNNHFYHTFCGEPVYFMQLAAELRDKKISTTILDGLLGKYDKKSLTEKVLAYNASVYCFSLFHSNFKETLDIMRALKLRKPKAVVVTGGAFASIHYNELLEQHSEIDYVVVGDADESLPRLCQCIINCQNVCGIPGVAHRQSGKIILTPPEPFDIDRAKPLERDFAEDTISNGISFSMVSSRGCGHGVCSFCYLPPYQQISNHPKWRGLSPSSMLSEIESLIEKYGIKHITFVDEDFFGSNETGVKRAIDFANLLIHRNIQITYYANSRIMSTLHMIKTGALELLARSGLRYLYIGIESGSNEILKKYKKGFTVENVIEASRILDKHGIKISPGLITFAPEFTIDIVKSNVDMLGLVKYYDMFMFTRRLVNLPGTGEDRCNKRFVILETHESTNQTSGVPEGYFCDNKTYLLYGGLIKYRNLLYPIYKDIARNHISEEKRKILISNHYNVFYELYNEIGKGKITHPNQLEMFTKIEIERTKRLVSSNNCVKRQPLV